MWRRSRPLDRGSQCPVLRPYLRPRTREGLPSARLHLPRHREVVVANRPGPIPVGGERDPPFEVTVDSFRAEAAVSTPSRGRGGRRAHGRTVLDTTYPSRPPRRPAGPSDHRRFAAIADPKVRQGDRARRTPMAWQRSAPVPHKPTAGSLSFALHRPPPPGFRASASRKVR